MTADLVLIGAGPHGLAVLSALADGPGSWPARVAVVDPHEGWAQAWDAKLARLDLDRLRSPQVHHPGQRPMALRDLVEARASSEQTALRRPEDERVPTPAGMRALVDELVATLGPIGWHLARASSVELVGDGNLRVRLDDGHSLLARNVVLANNPSTPRVPGWADRLIQTGTARHSSLVDVREESMSGRHIAIVGGGLTAGSLALAALDRGARVTLLTRRQLRARPYDVDASWLGPRRLAAFAVATQTDRRDLIDVARDGGTMPPRVLHELRERAQSSEGGLAIREAVDVEADLIELLDGTWRRRPSASGATVPAHAAAGSAGARPAATRPPAVDAVWLATGFENDVRGDPLLAPLVEALNIPVHRGLPEVTGDLRLPGSRIFVAGPYAALCIGPAARNLAGARPAAARIAAALIS